MQNRTFTFTSGGAESVGERFSAQNPREKRRHCFFGTEKYFHFVFRENKTLADGRRRKLGRRGVKYIPRRRTEKKREAYS
jgi:hypothetical protein